MYRFMLLPTLLAATLTAAQTRSLDAVDPATPTLTKKNTSLVVEGGNTFFKFGKQKFKLVSMQPLTRAQRRERAVRLDERLKKVTAPGNRDDEPQGVAIWPDEGAGPKDFSEDEVPKKVAAWASYYDPSGKRDGKAPPDEIDYRSYQTEVRAQGLRSTCSGFATTAVLESMPGFRDSRGGNHLSPEYAFWRYHGSSADAVCEDTGVTVEQISEQLGKHGLPLEEFWPYKDTCPGVDAPQQARDHAVYKPRHIYIINADGPLRDDARHKGKDQVTRTHKTAANDPRFLESVLAAGYTMVWGLQWPDIADIDSQMGSKEVIDLAFDSSGNATDVSGKGHFMALVGYKRTKGKHGGGYFIFKNSWGTDSSDGYVRLSYDMVRAFGDDGLIFTGTIKAGEGSKCTESIECAGYSAFGAEGTACCKSAGSETGTCQQTQRDFSGVYYCPAECRGAADRPAGTCDLKKDGESCSLDTECEDFDGAGQDGSACCGGKCTPKQADWAGVFYCPAQCVGKAGGKPGSCDELADKGESCKRDLDCEGFNGTGKKGVACCAGTCTSLRADFTGVYYCPKECRASAFSAAGSCKKPKKGKCSTDQDCSGGKSCCGGTCAKKRKDWAGVPYCPKDCVGKSGGKAGTCPI